MSGLATRVDRLPDRVLYTAALATVGLVYPAILALEGALPSLRALAPFLAAGILVGFAVDRFLGGRSLRSLGDRDLFARRLDSLRTLVAPADPTDVSVGSDRHESDRRESGADAGDPRGDVQEDADEDDSGASLWTLLSIVGTTGISSLLSFTAPWFVGLVLGLLWILVATRLVRLVSPLSRGLSRPSRGVPGDAIDGPE